MLGKGLESLIPKKGSQQNQGNFPAAPEPGGVFEDSNSRPEFEHQPATQEMPKAAQEPPHISGPVFHIEVEKIVLNPYQPRKEFDEEALNELASSIREFGILQPLVVSKTEEDSETGTKITYQLIAGQRRLMAAKRLGLGTVPAVIRNALKKTEALEMAIVENIQRADLNIIETARAYSRLSDEFGLTQREIASRLGKSREKIANALRLLALPTEIQDAVSRGKLNESQARLLLQIDDQQKRTELFNRIIGENLSVRDMKRFIARETPLQNASDKKPLTAEDIELRQLEKDLSEFLGAPVNVEFSRSGGKIVIHFYSPEEAKGIAQKIRPEDLM